MLTLSLRDKNGNYRKPPTSRLYTELLLDYLIKNEWEQHISARSNNTTKQYCKHPYVIRFRISNKYDQASVSLGHTVRKGFMISTKFVTVHDFLNNPTHYFNELRQSVFDYIL